MKPELLRALPKMDLLLARPALAGSPLPYALRRLGGDLPFGCHSWTKRRMRRAWRGIIPAAKCSARGAIPAPL